MITQWLAEVRARLAQADNVTNACDPRRFLELQVDSVADLARALELIEIMREALELVELYGHERDPSYYARESLTKADAVVKR